MPGFVVDASVSAAWLLPDEATLSTEAALQATATVDVWVPALWLVEIGNLLLTVQRRKRIDDAKRRALVSAASALRLRVDREPVSMVDLDALASRHRLTAYDAVYLELALRRKLPLATNDAALQAAMIAAGVAAPMLPTIFLEADAPVLQLSPTDISAVLNHEIDLDDSARAGDELHDGLKVRARSHGISVSELIRRTLEKDIQKDPLAEARSFFALLEPLHSWADVTPEAYVDALRSKSRLMR